MNAEDSKDGSEHGSEHGELVDWIAATRSQDGEMKEQIELCAIEGDDDAMGVDDL